MHGGDLAGWFVVSWLGGLALVGSASEAAKYDVGPQADAQDGAASGTGAATQRAASLSEVMDRLQPGDSVYLRGGIYRSTEVITARGTADQPIMIRPAPGQEAVIEQTTWKLKRAQHIILTGLTLRDCALALELLDDASYNTIEKNRFLDCPPLRPKLKQPTPWERALWGRGPNAHDNRIIDNESKRKYE